MQKLLERVQHGQSVQAGPFLNNSVRKCAKKCGLETRSQVISGRGASKRYRIWFLRPEKPQAEAMAKDELMETREQRDFLLRQLEKLNVLINSPETEDFLKAIPLEAAHQRGRWDDTSKTDEDWIFLFGWLAGKATQARKLGKIDKAKHHAITAAATLFNWHMRLTAGK